MTLQKFPCVVVPSAFFGSAVAAVDFVYVNEFSDFQVFYPFCGFLCPYSIGSYVRSSNPTCLVRAGFRKVYVYVKVDIKGGTAHVFCIGDFEQFQTAWHPHPTA